MFKNSVCTSQKTRCILITKTYKLTLFREIVFVKFENSTKQMSILSGIMHTSSMKCGDACANRW
jgi:hypothetical protein